jgi:hypothetical protein
MRAPDHVLHRQMCCAAGLLVLMAAMALHAAVSPADSRYRYKLTFDKLVTKWTEAVPLDNGRIGAMEFGRAKDERI